MQLQLIEYSTVCFEPCTSIASHLPRVIHIGIFVTMLSSVTNTIVHCYLCDYAYQYNQHGFKLADTAVIHYC